jgi:hypothetical protein
LGFIIDELLSAAEISNPFPSIVFISVNSLVRK